MNHHDLSEKHIGRLLFALMALFPLVGMAVDLIAPSLPAISEDLHTSQTFAKNLIAIYLIGFALGNLVLGFLSDAWGRRNLILAGFVGFFLASLLPPLFPHATVLLVARFLQGVCVAALSVISRGITADIVAPEKIVRTGALFATMWGLGPIIGPFIGGYLQAYFGWQACFYFFALWGLVGLVTLFLILPETLLHPQPLSLKQITTNFRTIISHKMFVCMVITMGANYALLISFNTLGPFFIQSVLSYSPIFFGHVALAMGAAFFVGTLFCRHFLKKNTPEKLIKFVIPFSFIITIIALMIAHFMPYNLMLLLITTGLMFFGCGLVYPAGIGKIMSLFRHIAGSAGAMMNFVINVVFTSMTAIVLSFIHVDTVLPIIWSYVILIGICLITHRVFLAKNSSTPIQ